ncbi:MAG: hypothetical protein AAF497_04060, partial [Planctomycetota bacterium]
MHLLRTVYAWFSQRVRVYRSTLYDVRRFLHWSFAVRAPRTRDQMKAFLTMTYHSLEKGLALTEPRVGFGTARIEDLVRMLRLYTDKYGVDETVAVCVNVLDAYQKWNLAREFSNPLVDDSIQFYRNQYPELSQYSEGGVLETSREEIMNSLSGGFES